MATTIIYQNSEKNSLWVKWKVAISTKLNSQICNYTLAPSTKEMVCTSYQQLSRRKGGKMASISLSKHSMITVLTKCLGGKLKLREFDVSKKIQTLLLFQLFQLFSYISFPFPYFSFIASFWLLVKSSFLFCLTK